MGKLWSFPIVLLLASSGFAQQQTGAELEKLVKLFSEPQAIAHYGECAPKAAGYFGCELALTTYGPEEWAAFPDGGEERRKACAKLRRELACSCPNLPHVGRFECVIEMADVPERMKLDIRKNTNADDLFMLTFFARDGLPGHAYVASFEFRNDANIFVETGVFGMYPEKNTTLWHLGSFPGEVDVRPDDSNPDIAISVWVNGSQYQRALQTRARFDVTGDYNLIQNDCVSMAHAVARTIGLKTPSRKWLKNLPYNYIRELARLNQDKQPPPTF